MRSNTSKFLYLALAFICLAFNGNPSRQYAAMVNSVNNRQYKGETKQEYFFNARKNPATGKMDYAAMLNCEQQIEKQRREHRPVSIFGLNWNNMGPTNIAGQTRALLKDKNDKTGQTLFAGAICGGLWKSTNGGNSWDSIAIALSNGCVSCIAQDSNGVIYIGTGDGFVTYLGGEGFSTAQLGAGIFKSTDDGKTFTVLNSTIPSIAYNATVNWAYTNRIALLPGSPNTIYAATNGGLMVSTDTGATFTFAKFGSLNITGNALDVKASDDGKLVVAYCNGSGYYTYTSSSTISFVKFNASAIPAPGPGGRIEFGIAPGNSNYVYASVASSSTFIGEFMTMTAVSSGNGGRWYKFLGGTSSTDPYTDGVSEDAVYANSIGVFPNNPGHVLFGGDVLYEWEQSTPSDTVGEWTVLTTYYGSPGDPKYIYPYIHNILIMPNSSTIYTSSDGGVFKRNDTLSVTGWTSANRGYVSTGLYSVSVTADVNEINGEGLLTGVQGNGTVYISGNFFYPHDGIELVGGTGGQCAISQLNPNIYYAGSQGMIYGANNLNSLTSPSSAYYNSSYVTGGANIDSVSNTDYACFVMPLAMYENPYDTATLDSITWVANKNYSAGDTIFPISPNAKVPFPYVLPNAVFSGNAIRIQNRVVSKIATAFTASGGVWLMMQADNFTIPAPIWVPIGGPLSKPDAFTGSDPVHCMTWAPDGNTLFVGTEDGQFFRFSNLDSVVDTAYNTGGLYLKNNSRIANSACRVVSTNLSKAITLGTLGDILSIAVDPKNGNNVIVTIGDYTPVNHIYYSKNALATTGVTFTAIQGDLPQMPIYCSVLDVMNSPYPNGALAGTEHGVYSCPDVTVSSPVWTPDNNGMTNTIIAAMKQQTLAAWQCNNSGDIYMASGGRGLYMDSTFFEPTGIAQINGASLQAKLGVYPNPMNTQGTISYTLPKAEKATITIYDIQGRVVKEIPLLQTSQGNHTVSINSVDMPVGAYIATLSGNDFRASAKFIVAR